MWWQEPYLSVKGDAAEIFCNPKYTEEHRNELTVERSSSDRGELIVEVFDEGLENDRFIGACHVHLTDFIKHAERTDSWKHTMFHLYDHQDVGDGKFTKHCYLSLLVTPRPIKLRHVLQLGLL